MRLVIYADGASRGNPGPAAFGAVILDAAGDEIRAIATPIGVATNNVAEYRGAIAGAQAAVELGATEIELYMDSELIVRQLEGRYRVRNKGLKPLYSELTMLLGQLEHVVIRHVSRVHNQRADELANAALDFEQEQED